MEAAKTFYKRRNYFIKKEFQGKFILKFILLIFLGTTISSGIVYYLTLKKLEAVYYRSHIKISSIGEIVYPILLTANIITIGIIIIITIMITLLISHKIAGPLYRIEKSIREISGGNLSFQIYLRAKDELVTLAEIFNSMIARLRERIEKIQDAARSLNDIAKEWNQAQSKIDRKKISNDITAMQKKVNDIEKVLAAFKLEK